MNVYKHNFGGDWTNEKLERLRKYLSAYTTIFNKNPKAKQFTTYYVDAFAGTGYRCNLTKDSDDTPTFPEMAELDTDNFLKGSARIALEVKPSFDKYIFIEQDPIHFKELKKLILEFEEKSNVIEIAQDNANTYIKK